MQEKEDLPLAIPETPIKSSVSQEEIHDLIFSRELGWHEIIYDLINSEQLDPWNINLTLLTDKYLEKINQLQEADFFISSKVLLAASLLLRIKSEFLLSNYLKSIDEILFGKKEKKLYSLERIELDEEIPELIPRSPMPRFRKVTLQELMDSLNKAIKTENRRIKRVLINKNALRESSFSLPQKTISIKDRIQGIYERLSGHFSTNIYSKNVKFSEFFGITKEEKVIHFYPLLQLENQKKVWLHQEQHFGEIHVWMHGTYLKNYDPLEDIKKQYAAIEEAEKIESPRKRKQAITKILNGDFSNSISADFEDSLEEEEFDEDGREITDKEIPDEEDPEEKNIKPNSDNYDFDED